MNLGYAGIVLGIISLIVSWHFGTKNSRRQRKIIKHQKELSKLDGYSKTTGYKGMIHDCFLNLFYALSIFLTALGVQQFLLSIVAVTDITIILYIKQIAAGLYIGSGFVLFDMFLTLVKASDPDISKYKINKKIEKLSNKI